MNRSKIEILYDMLVILEDGKKSTHIMYKANLNYAMLDRYLDILVAAQCAIFDGERYYITEKGRKIRDYMSTVLEVLAVEPETEKPQDRIL